MDRLRKGAHVFLRRPVAADEDEFLALMRRSLEFLAPWIYPPSDGEAFRDYLRGRDGERDDGFFLCLNDTGEIAGVINLNAIVRRWFQSAYLGYYMGAPFAGRGFMTEGIGLVMSFAFGDLGLPTGWRRTSSRETRPPSPWCAAAVFHPFGVVRRKQR